MKYKKIGVIWLLVQLFFWVTTLSMANPLRGKQLFKQKSCALCHRVDLPGTEFNPICPGLLGVKKRYRRSWLRKWLADPSAVWQTDDENIREINQRYFAYRGSKLHPRESFMATVIGNTIHLTVEEIESLIDYLMTL